MSDVKTRLAELKELLELGWITQKRFNEAIAHLKTLNVQPLFFMIDLAIYIEEG